MRKHLIGRVTSWGADLERREALWNARPQPPQGLNAKDLAKLSGDALGRYISTPGFGRGVR